MQIFFLLQMDQQTYAKMVESFLSKTRSGEKIGGTT